MESDKSLETDAGKKRPADEQAVPPAADPAPATAVVLNVAAAFTRIGEQMQAGNTRLAGELVAAFAPAVTTNERPLLVYMGIGHDARDLIATRFLEVKSLPGVLIEGLLAESKTSSMDEFLSKQHIVRVSDEDKDSDDCPFWFSVLHECLAFSVLPDPHNSAFDILIHSGCSDEKINAGCTAMGLEPLPSLAPPPSGDLSARGTRQALFAYNQERAKYKDALVDKLKTLIQQVTVRTISTSETGSAFLSLPRHAAPHIVFQCSRCVE
jgi:hypothetical protein